MTSRMEALDQAVEAATPAALGLILIFAAAVPMHVGQFEFFTPKVLLIMVYYWTIHFPERLTLGTVFLLGLFEDLLLGAPLGMNALVLALVHFLLVGQLNVFIGRPFVLTWAGFLPVVLSAAVIFWLMSSMDHGAFLSPVQFLLQAMVTMALYPLLGWVLGRLFRSAVR
ncbi:MAG: rod shape-determining protein MreD [Sphingomonadales bacterium]|nr:rod shape-determining protein MreD [Sphingomonadales bacterium]